MEQYCPRGEKKKPQSGFKAGRSGSAQSRRLTDITERSTVARARGSLGPQSEPRFVDPAASLVLAGPWSSEPFLSRALVLTGEGSYAPLQYACRSVYQHPTPPVHRGQAEGWLLHPSTTGPARESSKTETENWVVTASWLNLHHIIQFRGLIHNLLPPKTWAEVAG